MNALLWILGAVLLGVVYTLGYLRGSYVEGKRHLESLNRHHAYLTRESERNAKLSADLAKLGTGIARLGR